MAKKRLRSNLTRLRFFMIIFSVLFLISSIILFMIRDIIPKELSITINFFIGFFLLVGGIILGLITIFYKENLLARSHSIVFGIFPVKESKISNKVWYFRTIIIAIIALISGAYLILKGFGL